MPVAPAPIFTLLTLSLAAAPLHAGNQTEAVTQPWPSEKAWEWHDGQPWLVGCNFLPSTAVNDVEMWQQPTFDPQTIDRELGWAQELGFNTVRVFVNYVVWEADAEGLENRMDQFLQIADRHKIATMFILFDDCFKPEPHAGKQDDPVPGVHNSQWVSSPGARRTGDPSAWPKLEAYVKDVVGTFAGDRRVVIWDLYNEPRRSLELVEAAFRWARQARPSQPLTTCLFGPPQMQKRIAELSDVINFHNYGPLKGVRSQVAALRAHGRPVICTEWMARGHASRFDTHLPYFKAQRIGCWSWGLVAGRTQTYYPWGSKPKSPEPALWHHDLLRKDGTPFSPFEACVIRAATGVSDPIRWIEDVVPTARKQPILWRYTLEQPSQDWFKPDFDDSSWPEGAAPFGTLEPQHGRHPRTEWTSPHIWLRRTFDVPQGDHEMLVLSMHHDEDAEVYVNGVPAARVPGYNAAYERFDILPPARKALKPEGNVLAVHCRQTGGGQYLDVGLDGLAEAAAENAQNRPIDRATLDRWSAPYRNWHYWPGHVIGSKPGIRGYEGFHSTDVPTVFQLPGDPTWYMTFIGFDGRGYNSFVAQSRDLIHWSNIRLAMGFGPEGEFDHGGRALGAFLYHSYDVRAPRVLKKHQGKYWSLYGCYPRQGGYELRPGYEGVASSDDGITWRRAKETWILSVHDDDCTPWEKDCIYQPWLLAFAGKYYDFYNAAHGSIEQTGLAFSSDLLSWKRYSDNPIIRNRPGGYDERFASDPKVFRDGDHWTMFYFGVGRGGAHVMIAFSPDLLHWTAHPEPLYKAGAHPAGLDKTYAHKISLVYNPQNDTFYMFYCAVGKQGRGIGLLTSRLLPARE